MQRGVRHTCRIMKWQLLMKPRWKRAAGSKPAIMVELKADKDAETAIRQIKERRYAGALQHYKGAIILVGINYDKASKKHTCLIEKI